MPRHVRDFAQENQHRATLKRMFSRCFWRRGKSDQGVLSRLFHSMFSALLPLERRRDRFHTFLVQVCNGF